jgi:hypothetical protein
VVETMSTSKLLMNREAKLWLASHGPLHVSSWRSGIIAGIITGVTGSTQNHSMWIWGHHAAVDGRIDLRVASQDLFLRDKSLDEYLPMCRLRFAHNPIWTAEQKRVLVEYIQAQVALPARKRFYDYRGVLGHLFGLPSYNFPGLRYCSEFSGDCFKLVEPSFQFKHPSPEDINNWILTRPEVKVVAEWIPDMRMLVKF